MTQSNLDSRARKRIAQLAREGGTSRSILARLQAEGVHTSLAAVARVLAASPAPSGGSVRRRTPRKPSTGPAGARTAASVLADPSAVPNFLDRRIVKLMARAEEISESGTLGAEVKVLAAIATVAERSRALRPPPPVDPDVTDDTVAAQAELVKELERLVGLAEAEQRAEAGSP
jgi:hypothetical protein